MDINQKYKLTKNLDLKDENFLVKKGTEFQIVKLFDENDDSLETKISIKFNKINGNYLINESDFKSYLDKGDFKKLTESKFKKEDCIIHVSKGRGTVKDVWYDSFGGFYIYIITVSGTDYKTVEDSLRSCN